MRNPFFHDVLAAMAKIHDRKNHDYAQDGNPFSNFQFAARFAGVAVSTVFDVLIGIKQARLSELTAAGKEPNYESLQDTLLDRAVYATLAVAYDRALADSSGSPDDYIPGSEWDDYITPLAMQEGVMYEYDHEAGRYVPVGTGRDFCAEYGWCPEPAEPTAEEAAETATTRAEFYELGHIVPLHLPLDGLEESGSALAAQTVEGGRR